MTGSMAASITLMSASSARQSPMATFQRRSGSGLYPSGIVTLVFGCSCLNQPKMGWGTAPPPISPASTAATISSWKAKTETLRRLFRQPFMLNRTDDNADLLIMEVLETAGLRVGRDHQKNATRSVRLSEAKGEKGPH